MKRFANRRDAPEGYLPWIRSKVCTIRTHECHGWAIHAAHVKSRGAGGYDVGNVIPLCAFHHRQEHTEGHKSFWVRHNKDPQVIAKEIKTEWEGEWAA